ncbi:MAG: ABC transporter ATP-binding protein [Clostridiales bacterium]|nr:ABC transporter ATP-binding protein [Clostridiales bacterium]
MILSMKDVVKKYDQLVAVDNVSLEVTEGEIFGLLGPNGAGKTTIINMIIGLTKINSGEVKIFNKEIKKNEKEVKMNIGIVPQEIAIFEDLTAEENVAYFGKLYGLKRNIIKQEVEDALNFVGLWDKRKVFPKKFSGGMKRRLNIACGIVHKPKLVILDEPTVGIDAQSRNLILESIRELNKRGATIIYTSHYMEEVEEICSDIVIMDHGRIMARGSKEELKGLIKEEDRVVISVEEVKNSITQKIEKLSSVTSCIEENSEITIVSEKNSDNLGRIIDLVSNEGIKILSVEVEKPTLEKVFLTLTGRSLRD